MLSRQLSLQHGEKPSGIRTLTKELVVSHNTVAKAYSELEHEGLLELRHGSGAFVSARRRTKSRAEKARLARRVSKIAFVDDAQGMDIATFLLLCSAKAG